MKIGQLFSANRSRLAAAAGLLVLWGLLQINAVHDFGAKALGGEINRQNDVYLDGAEKEAREALLKLSEIFAIVEVARTSEVGISFIVKAQIEIGQALASLSNILERAMLISLATASAALVLKMVNALAAAISPILFQLVLVAGALYMLAASIHGRRLLTSFTHSVLEVSLLLFLTAYLVIPYSIHFTGWLGAQVTSDLREQTSSRLHDIHQDLHRTESKGELKDRAEHAIRNFEKMVVRLPQKVDAMVHLAVRKFAVALIDGIVLPLGIFVVLLLALRRILRHIGSLTQELMLAK